MRFKPLLALALMVAVPTNGHASTLTVKSLELAAKEFVQQTFASQGEVTVHVGSITPLGALLGTEVEIKPRFLQTPGSRGPVLIALEIHSKGRRLAQRTVTARVQVWRQVLVVSRGIQRHEELAEDAVNYERRDLRTFADRTFTDTAEIIGLRVKKSMRPGEVLLARVVERVPVIERGDKVSIQIRVGGVNVTARGTAQSNGALGESIDVKNSRSGKRLRCVVASKGLVRVPDGPSLRAER